MDQSNVNTSVRQKPSTVMVVVAIVIGTMVLAVGILPFLVSPIKGGRENQLVYSWRQIYLAALSMANDGEVQGDASLQWPGDWRDNELKQGRLGDATGYLLTLADRGYIKKADLQKVFAYPGWSALDEKATHFDARRHCPMKIYAYRDQDPENTLLFASKNFFYDGASAETALGSNAKQRFFVVIRAGGDGTAYQPAQAKSPALVGQLPRRSSTEDDPFEHPKDRLLE